MKRWTKEQDEALEVLQKECMAAKEDYKHSIDRMLEVIYSKTSGRLKPLDDVSAFLMEYGQETLDMLAQHFDVSNAAHAPYPLFGVTGDDARKPCPAPMIYVPRPSPSKGLSGDYPKPGELVYVHGNGDARFGLNTHQFVFVPSNGRWPNIVWVDADSYAIEYPLPEGCQVCDMALLPALPPVPPAPPTPQVVVIPRPAARDLIKRRRFPRAPEAGDYFQIDDDIFFILGLSYVRLPLSVDAWPRIEKHGLHGYRLAGPLPDGCEVLRLDERNEQ